MRVEDLTRDNQDEARSLVLAGLADHWGSVDETLNPDLDDMTTSYQDGRTVLIRDADGAVVGTGTLLPRSEGVAEIRRMSVASDVRRRGIGRRIVDELLATATDWGVGVVVLETTSTWHEEISFYLHCGFTITHVEHGDFGSDTWFEQRLDPPEQHDAIEIRVATPDDADVVADYHQKCFANTYRSQLLAGELQPPDREGTRQQLHDWFQSESEFATRVAVVDGVPIGHFTVRRNQLVHLFVDPDHHGTGLGRRLLAQGEAMIAARGHTDLELHTRVDNHPAVAFYTAMGWAMTDRLIRTVEHGISYDEHVLVKHRRAS